jgi:hypothetical protein
MNANGLTKLYAKLNPEERLPLILAASARGDIAERNRLAQSAPVETFRVPHHHRLAEALKRVSLHYVNAMLHLAAMFWQLDSVLDQCFLSEDGAGENYDLRFGTMRMVGYLLVCHADGWRAFCDEMKIDPEQLHRFVPGYSTALRAESAGHIVAFSKEEATTWARQSRDQAVEIATPQKVALELSEIVRSWSDSVV